MGATGAIIMGLFGAVFAVATLALVLGERGVVLVAPLLVFLAIVAAALAVRRAPGARLTLSREAERVVMWSTIAEGIGIFVAIQLVATLGRPDWALPAVALVVGLHFLPIARAAALGAFAVLGAALIVAAVLGIALSPPLGPAVSGSAAALALWIAALLAIRREARSKRSA